LPITIQDSAALVESNVAPESHMAQYRASHRLSLRTTAIAAGALLLYAGACSMDTSAASFAPERMPARNPGRAPGVSAGAGGSGITGASGTGASGSFGNTGQQPTAGSGAAPGGPQSGADDPNTCAEGTANATPITPTVWLVVDGSSSMTQMFEAATRWQTLRSTLMDPSGVVASLQSVARIGMVIYSGGGLLAAECVDLVTVPPALDNYAAIDAMYPQLPIGTGTPTDRALDHVVTNLPVTNAAGGTLDTEVEPVYVVLATDGAPNDSCSGLFGNSDQVEQAVVDVTARGTQMGMEMFIISLAGGDAQLQSHLQEVAMATSRQTPPFVPATQAELVATFRDVVGGAACQVSLDGMVTAGQQCRGEVLLNGIALPCESDDGWRMSDPRTVQLTGSACADFQANPSQVYARFPCDAFAPD
jgi:hypothetical protein